MVNLLIGISADCPALINFAAGLGMQQGDLSLWNVLNNDCCLARYVTCDAQLVIKIQWVNMDLLGSLNGTAIPLGLQHLELYGNQLTGAIPILPNGLNHLDLSMNKLTGIIPSPLPNGMTYLHLHQNLLSGDLPDFPHTLSFLSLGYVGSAGNHNTGSLRLNAPSDLRINDNWITDVIILDTRYLNSGNCDLSHNPLLGNQNIVNLTMCQQNGLYSAGLLPQTKSTLKLYTETTRPLRDTLTVFSTTIYRTTLPSTSIVDTLGPIKSTSVPKKFFFTATASATLLGSGIVSPIVDPQLIYGLLGGFIGLCILVGIAKLVFKHPKMHSKFGRKNSFGTLNTVATKQMTRTF